MILLLKAGTQAARDVWESSRAAAETERLNVTTYLGPEVNLNLDSVIVFRECTTINQIESLELNKISQRI